MYIVCVIICVCVLACTVFSTYSHIGAVLQTILRSKRRRGCQLSSSSFVELRLQVILRLNTDAGLQIIVEPHHYALRSANQSHNPVATADL